VNINGKHLLALLLICCSFTTYGEKLTIRATSMNGVTLINAGVGEPFLIEVILNNITQQINTPQIANDGVHIPRYCGFQMTSTNGNNSVKYQYQMRIDEPGEYILGPAKIVDNEKVLLSDPIKLRVTEDTKTAEQKKTRASRHLKEPFMRLATETKHAIVGQKVSVSAAFYFQAGKHEIVQIHESDDVDGIISSKVKNGPYQGTTSIDGSEYQFIMYTWDVYPTKTGTVVIPALAAEFRAVPDKNDFFGAFAAMLNRATAIKRLYSNSLTLQVVPLPKNAQEVQAIGTFTGFNAEVTPSVAKVGQGMAYTLALQGDGNFEHIKAPPLQAIPDGCKWYESKKSINQLDKDTVQLKFEYVIQGITPGDWTLPEQTISYYDTDRSRVASLKSQALSITILSDSALHSITPAVTSGSNVDFEQTPVEQKNILIAPIKQYGPIQFSNYLFIPWHIFLMLLLFLILLSALYCWYVMKAGKISIKSAIKLTKSKIEKVHTSPQNGQLYILMRNLIAQIMGCEPGQIDLQVINQFVQKMDLSVHEQNAFLNYWQDLEQQQYYQSNNSLALQRTSLAWINNFSKAAAIKKLVLLLAISWMSCSAINIQETFLQANLFAEAHNYSKALELYQAIPKKGYSVLFNSSVAYFQEHNYVQALARAHAALRIATTKEKYDDAQFIIDQSREKLNITHDQSLMDTLYRLFLPFNVLLMQCIFLLLLLLFLWHLVKAICSHKLNLTAIISACFLFLVSILLFTYYYQSLCKVAFATQELTLFAAPHKGVDQIGSLPQGTQLQVVYNTTEWSKIRNKNLVGWVLNDTLTAVEK